MVQINLVIADDPHGGCVVSNVAFRVLPQLFEKERILSVITARPDGRGYFRRP